MILNWAKYLAWNQHNVTLYSVNGSMSKPWFTLPDEVRMQYGWPRQDVYASSDIVVATNPDTLFYSLKKTHKLIYLCQMAEELFFEPESEPWIRALAAAFLPVPMITVADWVKYRYANFQPTKNYGSRQEPIYVVPNGTDIDFIHHIPQQQIENPVIIVEGWNANNKAKDTAGIVRKVVQKLKESRPIKIIGYGQTEIEELRLFDEYYVMPSTETLASLYSQANFLLKASQYETRSLAPLEAMACGCIPVVAIRQGHPDLWHRYNAFVTPYEAYAYMEAVETALALPIEERHRMKENGRNTVRQWQDVVYQMVEPILTQYANAIS